jgi:hypothetical protein
VSVVDNTDTPPARHRRDGVTRRTAEKKERTRPPYGKDLLDAGHEVARADAVVEGLVRLHRIVKHVAVGDRRALEAHGDQVALLGLVPLRVRLLDLIY